MTGNLLKRKNAVITGARRGIGRATVETFASEGANVWACARQPDAGFEAEMRSLAERYDVSIWPVYFDVIREEEMKQAMTAIKRQKAPVDILVNAAGIVEKNVSFQMMSMEQMLHVFQVNFFAVTLLTQYISRLMMRHCGGSIVNIASIAGLDGDPSQYEYAASKGAIIGGTKKLARELAMHHIRVNAVAPGMVETDMGSMINEQLKEEVLSKVIMKRMGTPREIANCIAFLASDRASYITGQIIRVDGGM